MEHVTTGHWIFAGIFAVLFVVGITFAYRDDIKKSPELFSGSSKFLISVLVTLMILLVIKMIHRLG